MIVLRRHSVAEGVGLRGVTLAACTGVILTVLSQITPALQILYGLIWFSLVVYGAVHEAPVIKLSHVFLGTLSLFFCLVVYCCVCLLSTGDTGYITGYPVLLAKALLMYVVGYFLSFYAGGGKASGNIFLLLLWLRHVSTVYGRLQRMFRVLVRG